ncbi:hypothetical protein ACWDYH_35620 [Nocardia goodfellowii]
MRERINDARHRQLTTPPPDHTSDHSAGPASLRTDLELARAEITRLRDQLSELTATMLSHLGAQLEGLDTASIRQRNHELTSELHTLAAGLAQARSERDSALHRLTETEDALAAARMSLRRMIKGTN